jgi:hypothetical protein
MQGSPEIPVIASQQESKKSDFGKVFTKSCKPIRSRGGIAMEAIGALLKQFGLDTGYCNVVEETLLTLAGVEDKPAKACFYDPALNGGAKLKKLDALELKNVERTSMFFEIPLSEDNLNRVLKFLKENGIECNDYTRLLSDEDRQSNIKLIRVNADNAQEILFPKIVEHLKLNESEIERHIDVMHKERGTRRERHKLAVESSESKDAPIKDQKSSEAYSWGRLFNKRNAIVALTFTAAAAAATMTFAKGR